jgi:hypothetical protein
VEGSSAQSRLFPPFGRGPISALFRRLSPQRPLTRSGQSGS